MARHDRTGDLNLGASRRTKTLQEFLPEVSFERFGLFALHLSSYADEIDRDNAHRSLGLRGAGSEDWRWTWAQVAPLHYSECPLYSPLAHDSANSPTVNPTMVRKRDEVFSIKPNFHGISVDVKGLFKRFQKWWQARRQRTLLHRTSELGTKAAPADKIAPSLRHVR